MLFADGGEGVDEGVDGIDVVFVIVGPGWAEGIEDEDGVRDFSEDFDPGVAEFGEDFEIVCAGGEEDFFGGDAQGLAGDGFSARGRPLLGVVEADSGAGEEMNFFGVGVLGVFVWFGERAGEEAVDGF